MDPVFADDVMVVPVHELEGAAGFEGDAKRSIPPGCCSIMNDGVGGQLAH